MMQAILMTVVVWSLSGLPVLSTYKLAPFSSLTFPGNADRKGVTVGDIDSCEIS